MFTHRRIPAEEVRIFFSSIIYFDCFVIVWFKFGMIQILTNMNVLFFSYLNLFSIIGYSSVISIHKYNSLLIMFLHHLPTSDIPVVGTKRGSYFYQLTTIYCIGDQVTFIVNLI